MMLFFSRVAACCHFSLLLRHYRLFSTPHAGTSVYTHHNNVNTVCAIILRRFTPAAAIFSIIAIALLSSSASIFMILSDTPPIFLLRCRHMPPYFQCRHAAFFSLMPLMLMMLSLISLLYCRYYTRCHIAIAAMPDGHAAIDA